MIDFRLYRIAWLPALAAFVVMMFSLDGIPGPPDPQIAPATFDSERARDTAQDILAAAPERVAGGQGDAVAADLVLDRFEEVEAGTAAAQTFEAEVDGSDEELRNVVLTLAGESDETVLVMAARDSASGPGAASSAAATAALIELGEVLGGTEHAKTIVLVSTDAGSEGAEGARRFIEAFDERDQIVAAVVLVQPGSADPEQPHVLRHSTDDASTSMGLVRTAEALLAEQSGRGSGGSGLFGGLSRLAVPMAAGEQAVLISEGIDAIAISSAGERPLAPEEDTADDLDAEVLGEFGAAALGTVLVLDPLTEPLTHGPDTYVEFSGSLLPGWAIAVFSLALLVPAAVAALDGVARAARRRAGVVQAIIWAYALALPLAGLVIAVLVAGVAGLIADPAYPFDPGRFDLGVPEALLIIALLAAAVCGYALTGLGHPPTRSRWEALAPALGAAAVTGALALWLVNPYLALLLVPAAHVWLLADRPRPRALVGLCLLLSVLPAVLAVRSSASAVGAEPSDLLLMVVDGQFPAFPLLALCLVGGTLAGMLVLLAHPRGARTDDRDLGGNPQPEWGPPEARPAAGSIDSAPTKADEWMREEPGTDPPRASPRS